MKSGSLKIRPKHDGPENVDRVDALDTGANCTALQDDDFNQTGLGEPDSREREPESRRRAAKDLVCRHCGQPVQGRRTNGYCSDRCRMRDRRDEHRRKRLELLDTISAAVEELRGALGGI